MIIYPEAQESFSPDNPEKAWRAIRIKERLEEEGFKIVSAEKAKKSDVLLAHHEDYVNFIELASKKGGEWLTPDTPVLKGTFEVALESVGSAVQAMYVCGFAVSRPPGHHAGIDFGGGFCYFNNIAVATLKALEEGFTRAFVLDIDLHHGNGTQDIFWANPNVFFMSIQQDPSTCFPWKVPSNNEHVLNINLKPGTGDEEYLKYFEVFPKKAKEFKPDIIGVSVGFDTWHKDWETGNLGIRRMETYERLGRRIREVAEELEAQFFAVLEGGYSKDLPELALMFVRGLFGV